MTKQENSTMENSTYLVLFEANPLKFDKIADGQKSGLPDEAQ